MGNCCFPNKIGIEDNVVGDERLIPEGEISLIFSEKFNCYMLRLYLRNFEKYYFRLWTEGERSPYVTDSTDYSDSNSRVDVPDF